MMNGNLAFNAESWLNIGWSAKKKAQKPHKNTIQKKNAFKKKKKKAVKMKKILKKKLKKNKILKKKLKKKKILKKKLKKKKILKKKKKLKIVKIAGPKLGKGFLKSYAPNKDRNRFYMLTPQYPSVTLDHKQYVRAITQMYSEFRWAVPKLKSACDFKGGPLTLSNTQNFIRHYMTPRIIHKGLLMVIATGGGKTCTGVALTNNFPRVLWVTKTNLRPGIWNAMFNDLCSGIIREWKEMGRPIPHELGKRLQILKHQGTNFLPPMSYRQFSNALRPGVPTALGRSLIASSPMGAKDPLAECLIVIDESHLLYDKDKLPAVQRPQMKNIEVALERSYNVSKFKSCRLALMTATPATNPVILFKQLNLMIPALAGKLPIDSKTILAKFASPSGKLTPSGAKILLIKTKGMVSYLNTQKDASKFAQVKRQTPVKVLVSEMQVKRLKACTAKSIKNPGKCIRRKLNVSERKATESFDHPQFNGPAFMERMPDISPGMISLMQNIQRLDKADRSTHGHIFKHVIFSDLRNNFGAKFIASAMVASGKYNMIVKNGGGKLVVDAKKVAGKQNLAILTTTGLYKKGANRISFSNRVVASLVDKSKGVFNTRENRHGKDCQILVINDDFAVGFDAFDVKYIHIFNPQISQTNLTQVEGRGTRFCGTTGLDFIPGKGWELLVFTYVRDWANADDLAKVGKGKTPFEFMTDHLKGQDIKLMQFNNHLRNILFSSAVDWNLNAGINLGRLIR